MNIIEKLNWLESKSDMAWLWTDTETTGLGGHEKEQLTQISSIATKYNFNLNEFTEIEAFDSKIKLTTDIKKRYATPNDNSRKILSLNNYGSGNYKYIKEKVVLDDFFIWIDKFPMSLLIFQNAPFDIDMLSGRYGHKIKSEVFDTKLLIQLYYIPLLQKMVEDDIEYQKIIDFIGTSKRDNGLISSSMSKIAPSLGVDMNNYHTAIDDCRITMQMYVKIIKILKEHGNIDIYKYQLERLNSLKYE